jgi:hypothetical protein
MSKIYGEDNERLLAYEREKELIRKRDETKAELKALLKKYVSSHSQMVLGGASGMERGFTNDCAEIVGLAQVEMDGMHTRLDKAVYDINRKNEECKWHNV